MNDTNLCPSKIVSASPGSPGKPICGFNFSLRESVSTSVFCPSKQVIGSNVRSSKLISTSSLFSRKPNYG